jgi:hypothetical protein
VSFIILWFAVSIHLYAAMILIVLTKAMSLKSDADNLLPGTMSNY